MPLSMVLNGNTETPENQENTGISMETTDGIDAPDGIFRPGSSGCYRPRIEEMESWGRPLETLGTEDERDSHLLALLRADPEYRWRCGLIELLHNCKDREQCHKALFFLYNIVKEGSRARERGVGENVAFNPSDAPEYFSCTDWLNIVHGLNFVTTSPGTIRDISYVDVQTGANTDQAVLKGFCFLLKCLGCLSWENVQEVLTLDKKDGLHLYQTISHLQCGYGLEHDSRRLLETLNNQCGGVLLDLGFRLSGLNTKWQKPKNNQTFDSINTILYILFTSADKIETVV